MSENENDLTARGIAAYEAGNKKEAAQYLSQAAREDKSNERVWYYLAQLVNDSEKRQQCLENVLKLNPDHAEARAELDQLLTEPPADTPQSETEPSQPETPPQPEEPAPQAAAPPADKTTTADDTSPETIPLPRPEPQLPEGLSLPLLSAIPGAPQVISVEEVSTSAAKLLLRSMEILAGHEIPAAGITWWNIWLTTGIIGFITGAMIVVRSLIISIGFLTSPNILSLITRPLLSVVTLSAAVAAGGYLSHWYLTRQEGGEGSLLNHFHVMVSVWAPAALLLNIVILLEGVFRAAVITVPRLLFGSLGGTSALLTLVAIAITVYAINLMAKHLEPLHELSGRPLYLAAALMLTVTAFLF
jgi:hypothetical protein